MLQNPDQAMDLMRSVNDELTAMKRGITRPSDHPEDTELLRHPTEQNDRPLLIGRDYQAAVRTLISKLHTSALDDLSTPTYLSDIVRVLDQYIPNNSVGAP